MFGETDGEGVMLSRFLVLLLPLLVLLLERGGGGGGGGAVSFVGFVVSS